MSSAHTLEDKLSAIVEKYAARKDTSDVRFALSSPSREWCWSWGADDEPSQYFIASITKLYVAAIIMQLRAEGVIDIDVPAAAYLPPATMYGLNVFAGEGYSERVTVRQLLSHTSGIADYFEQKRTDKGTTFGRALEGDYRWTFDDVLDITRTKMAPQFPPGTPKHAYYSDTNYQLLGAIIEHVTGVSWERALYDRILVPLELASTYAFTQQTEDRYDDIAPMLYGDTVLKIPGVMSSVRADGGIVSTAEDGLEFLQAFMQSKLFPAEMLYEMTARWNKIFSPLEYGIGVMRFKLPRAYSPLRKPPVFVGHSGASGAVLFRVESLDLYLSGTVNQVKKRSLSFELMTRLAMACDGAWK